MTYLVLNEDTRIVVRGFESRAAATDWIGKTQTYRDSVGLERARYRVIPVSAAMRPEELARLFHSTYEALAPSYGYETRPDSAAQWDDVPKRNRDLMVATCAVVLARLRCVAL